MMSGCFRKKTIYTTHYLLIVISNLASSKISAAS
jgi:hypothetical protein